MDAHPAVIRAQCKAQLNVPIWSATVTEKNHSEGHTRQAVYAMKRGVTDVIPILAAMPFFVALPTRVNDRALDGPLRIAFPHWRLCTLAV